MKQYHPNISTKFQKAERMRFQSGFTLIELMIAIAVLAILSAIAAPNFETMVYGSSSNRAVAELVSELQLARMKAIRTHRPVTVSFNAPAQDQYTVAWTDDIVGARTKVVQLDPRSGRVGFDNSPPGGAVTPDTSFTFSNLGFVTPSSGGRVGFIYLVDNRNARRFGIATTVSGGIDELRWSGSSWSGPDYEFTSAAP